MSANYDIDHAGDDAKSALRAIVARIDGVFDQPDLAAYGPLHTDPLVDIKRIAENVDTEEDDDG